MGDFDVLGSVPTLARSASQSVSAAKSNLASNVRRPRSVSAHAIPAPLGQPPNRPNSEYKTFLRYHPKETKRVVSQQAVNRLTQKNLERNVKETLTGKTRFWDDKQASAKGKLGVGPKATTLRNLTLHRQREQLLQAVRQSERRLETITSGPTNNAEVVSALENSRRDVQDLMTVLRFHKTELESRVTQQTATAEDKLYLAYLNANLPDLEKDAASIDESLGLLPDHTAWYAATQAHDQFSRLDNKLVSLRKVWQRSLPESLRNMGDRQSVRAAAKPVVETLTAKEQLRKKQGERLKQLSDVLTQASDGGLVQLALHCKLAGLSKAGKAALKEELQQSRPEANQDEVSLAQKMERYANVLAAASNHEMIDELKSKFDLPSDKVSLKQHLMTMPPQERSALLEQADVKLDGWRDEHKRLMDDLKPKNYVQKKWSSFKSWFSKSVLRRPGLEVAGFTTELGLAAKEAEEVADELHEAELEEHEESSLESEGPSEDHGSVHDSAHTGEHATVGHGTAEHETAEHGAAEHISHAMMFGKSLLHTTSAVRNLDDLNHLRKERAHLKHKMHVSKEKLEEYEHERATMNTVSKYRSSIVKSLYDKTGDQSLALVHAEMGIAGIQTSRHLASLTHDALVKAGFAGHALKSVGAGAAFGAAAAEYGEGFVGAAKAIDAQKVKSHLGSRIKEVKQLIKAANDEELLESLQFQLRTLEDLSDQQDRLTNALSSLKGFGMGAGYTLLGLTALGVASTGVAAPVLLAVFAGTAVGIAAYKAAKQSHASWKIDRSEDLMLGRGGSQKFLDGVRKQAEETGTTPEQVILTRICRGKGPDAKRPSSRKLLHDLKWETQQARASDHWIESRLAPLEQQIEQYGIESQNRNNDPGMMQWYRQEHGKLAKQRDELVATHTQEIMKSPTAQTLRNAYQMKESEIVALVDAPLDDQHDEYGVQLISEYQNELTE